MKVLHKIQTLIIVFLFSCTSRLPGVGTSKGRSIASVEKDSSGNSGAETIQTILNSYSSFVGPKK